MKRRLPILAACVALCCAAFALSGCQALQSLGIGGEPYEPTLKPATVQAPAIAKDGVLRVGVDANNAPFSTTVSGKIVGLDVDVAAALATEMGLQLEVVDVGSNPTGALQDGSVDVVMGQDFADTTGVAYLTRAYLPTAVALFAASDTATMPIEGGEGVLIEAQSASMSAWEVTNQFGEASLRSAPDLKTAFEDLADGATAYVAADAVIGTYVAYNANIDARVIGLMQKLGGYCVGVGLSNDQLKEAVSTALDAILANGTVGVIENKWLGGTIDLTNVAMTAAAAKAASAEFPTLADTGAATAEGDDAAQAAAGEQGGDADAENAGEGAEDAGEGDYDEAGGVDYDEEDAE